MNTEHTPRLYKALGMLLFGAGALGVARLINNDVDFVFNLFGWITFIVGVAEAVACNVSHYAEIQTRHYMIQKEVIDSLAKADPDVRNAIGAWFPRYNFVFAGQPIVCWQDTIVPLDVFREFMKESNQQYTVAQREWKARGATYHRYWVLIYEKLVEIGLVVKDSSAGNHSEMWSGRGYDRAWQMWMIHSMNLQELTD